jgi:hypothetical protein
MRNRDELIGKPRNARRGRRGVAPRGHSTLKDDSFVMTGESAWENEGGAALPPELEFASKERKGANSFPTTDG